MSDANPFDLPATVGMARKLLSEIDARTRQLSIGAHVEACEAIMTHAVLRRVELAAKAASNWDPTVQVSGVFQTQTHTGVLHLRVKMTMWPKTTDEAVIEFIGSPKSNVIACEAKKGHSKHRWPKVSLTAEGISTHVDRALKEFLQWCP